MAEEGCFFKAKGEHYFIEFIIESVFAGIFYLIFSDADCMSRTPQFMVGAVLTGKQLFIKSTF